MLRRRSRICWRFSPVSGWTAIRSAPGYEYDAAKKEHGHAPQTCNPRTST